MAGGVTDFISAGFGAGSPLSGVPSINSSATSSAYSTGTLANGDIILGGGSKNGSMNYLLLGGVALFAIILIKKL